MLQKYFRFLCFFGWHRYVSVIYYYNNKKIKHFYCQDCNKEFDID